MYKLSRTILVTSLIVSAVFVAGTIADFWPLSAVPCVLVLIGMFVKKGYRRLTSLGSARWADENDLRRSGMIDAGRGLIIGRLPGRKRRPLMYAVPGLFRGKIDAKAACRPFAPRMVRGKSDLISIPNAVHTAVFAPSGVGKGVSCIVPFLKTCDESCVVLDFKGENWKLTAEHRREHLGHRIVVLDPFKVVTATPDSFNPLDFIDKNDPQAMDACNELAKALVVRPGEQKERHWDDSAEAWIAALTAMVVQYGDVREKTRSLQTVRTILSNPQSLESAVKGMVESSAWHGLLARAGGQLMHFVEREKSSTLTTAGRHLKFLDSLTVLDSTTSSSFDPAELRRGKMTVYLVLPPNQIQVQSSLLRMWVTSLFRAVVAGGLQERRRVHFILDEASALGHLDAIDEAVDRYRGYGVRMQLYYQSMGQLKKCWPEGQDQTLLSNTTQVFFGVNDQAIGTGGTADYVSALLGDETIIVDSGGRTSGTSTSNSRGMKESSSSSSYSDSTTRNWQQQARRLLKPEEVCALPPRQAITFTPGLPPIRTELIRYYEEPSLGVRPGKIGRAAAAVGTLINCSVFAVLFVLVAFGLTQFAHDMATGPNRRGANSNQIHATWPDVPAKRQPSQLQGVSHVRND